MERETRGVEFSWPGLPRGWPGDRNCDGRVRLNHLETGVPGGRRHGAANVLQAARRAPMEPGDHQADSSAAGRVLGGSPSAALLDSQELESLLLNIDASL